MKISRIEIFGFKSFLERIVLPVDKGITAIVGPNGCGKSNIVDALRWVFGETRASQLRGAHLEDVIFNGTETLRPLGLAEVSLVIATDKPNLYEDIFNSKRALEAAVKADGDEDPQLQSEQPDSSTDQPNGLEADNDQQVPAARPRLFVIDGALANKSSEAPQDSETKSDAENFDFEKAENTSEALQAEPSLEDKSAELPVAKVEQEDPALARFSWLKLSREVEVTRRLYRSGESEFFINKVACRLRDLKDLFRLLGLGARSYTLVAQGEVSRIITSKPEERRLMIEEAAGVSGVRERLAAAQKRLEDTKLSLTRLNDLMQEVTRQVNSLRVQATRARNRAELKERLRFLDLSIIGDRMRSFSEQTESIEIEVNLLKEREQSSKQQLDTLLVNEEAIQRHLVEINSKRETLSQKIRVGRVELAARKAQRSAIESEAQSIEHELRARISQFEELSQRALATNEQVCNAESELEQFTSSISELQNSIGLMEKSSSEELQISAKELETSRKDCQIAKNNFQELRSAGHAISAKIEAIEEQLNLQGQKGSFLAGSELAESLSPLLSHVHASEELRKSLEVAISHYAEMQVCEDLPTFVTKLINSRDLSTAENSLKVIGRNNLTGARPQQFGEVPFERLLSKLEITDGYLPIFEKLIGNVFVCENLQQALDFFASKTDQPDSIQGMAVVTKSAELISSESFVLYRDSSGPVEKYARRREMLSQLEANETIVAAAHAECDRLDALVLSCEERHAAALQSSVEAEQEIRKLTSELGALRGKAEVISRLVTQLNTEKSNIDVALSAWDVERTSLDSRLEDLKSMLEVPVDGESTLDQEALDEFELELDEINSHGKELIDSLEQRSKDRDQARSEFEELTALRSKAEFKHEKLNLEKQASLSRLHDLYPEMDASQIMQETALSEEDQVSYSEESERLRTRIQREGEVDPASIALFEAEEARLEELKTQRIDLETAEKTLAETVLQLSELAKKRFLETFKIVQTNFARLIPRVFGGGFGALHLENMDDPFEGGIEVSVRPPGKKPKSIELLSGGERALCAIALIFSMFLHKPSPLCVLDEVDAPLDEANLRRYLKMVREMSTVTQFLMISHNKESMAAADRLVGVTQEQPGASQIVTVSLEQAQAAVG